MKLTQAERTVADPNQAIDNYILAHSENEPEYLQSVVRETNLQMINPRMMSGHLQGRLLKMLVAMTGAKRIVEIGTYSGYSALCMAEALPDDGELHTIEIDDEQEAFILQQISSAPHGEKITLHIGDGVEVIPTLTGEFDFAFIDADKRVYQQYYDLLLPRMRKGGVMLIDNTLWDGKVLIDKPASNDYQTIAIKLFNDTVAADDRVEKVILPMRDGLTLVQVK
ncbi:MAG: class I SAM-dependent methyltransferase [bacterium]